MANLMFGKSGNLGRESLRPVMPSLRQITEIVLVFCLMPVTLAPAAVSATQRSSQPGTLVDIGSHRLHIWCVGTGRSTAVIDSGLGGNSL